MKYTLLKKKLQLYPYFTSGIFHVLGVSEKTLYNQLDGWVKKGYLLRLRRGLYTLNHDDRRAGLSKRLIANILYTPSYISMETALSYYGLIPEAVYSTVSVTTKKTQKFTNNFGEFLYRNIKPEAFFGFQCIKDEFGFDCLVATPEKALLDYFYFNIPSSAKIDGNFFEEFVRLQNVEQVDSKKIQEMARRMKNKKVEKIVKRFIKWREGT